MIKHKLERIDISLLDEVNKISKERVKSGIDQKTRSCRRMTEAIANLIKKDEDLRKRLISAELK